MAQLDQQLRRRRGKKKEGQFPQVALVALDPYTGDIRALVGGRSYTNSQLNQRLPSVNQDRLSSLSCMQPRSIESTKNSGEQEVITAASLFLDEPTTFTFNNQVYEPANFTTTITET